MKTPHNTRYTRILPSVVAGELGWGGWWKLGEGLVLDPRGESVL